VALGAIGVAVIVGAGSVVWSSMSSPVEQVIPDALSDSSRTVSVRGSTEVVVHVSGEVMRPGIISLAEGARVIDAVERAGGQTAQAALDSINLARLVIDGEHLVVPAEGEAEALTAGSSGLVSLSLASEQELQELPGVGPAIASRIVSWRDAHGPFRHVEDILAVSGIGPATLEKFRDRVTP
jgi:competence protein ComEA